MSWPSRPAKRPITGGDRPVTREAAQGAVDEDPHGPFGTAQHAGDLRRRHLIDEAQDERPTSVAGEAIHGSPRGGRVVVDHRVALDIDRGGDRGRRIEGGLRPATSRSPPFRDRVPGDLEEPHAERGGTLAIGRAGALLEPTQVGEGRQERPLSGVFGLVVVAQFVVGEAVHLGEVLPIEGLETGRIRLGGLHEPPVAVEVGQARTARFGVVYLPECRPSHRVTPPATIGSASRT